MDAQLQHDPRIKQQIKDALYAFLYTPIEKQFEKRLSELIVKNTLLCGYSHKSFMYKNTLYNIDTTAPPRKMNRLHINLQGPMNDYLKDLKALNESEVPYVLGYINQVLNSSNDLCDYLRLLPEAVHGPIQHLIATYPCKSKKLPEEMVSVLQDKNTTSINMMKKRMVTNLLIQ